MVAMTPISAFKLVLGITVSAIMIIAVALTVSILFAPSSKQLWSRWCGSVGGFVEYRSQTLNWGPNETELRLYDACVSDGKIVGTWAR